MIDLTTEESEDESEDLVVVTPIYKKVNIKNDPNWFMGIDIGRRNTAISVYSTRSNSTIWWVWVDFQGYCPVTKMANLVHRLSDFIHDYKGVFKRCYKIRLEGQTEVIGHKSNMYLQQNFQARFPKKTTIQNSRAMGTMVRKLVPEWYLKKLERVGKNEKFVKKQSTMYIGKKMVGTRNSEKRLYVKIKKDRAAHQLFIKSLEGRNKRLELETLEDEEYRIRGIGNKRKKNQRIKWSETLKVEEDDIWDAYFMAMIEAEESTGKDIIKKRLASAHNEILIFV